MLLLWLTTTKAHFIEHLVGERIPLLVLIFQLIDRGLFVFDLVLIECVLIPMIERLIHVVHLLFYFDIGHKIYAKKIKLLYM